MRKILLCAALVLVLVMLGFAGCTTDDNKGPVTHTDHMGNTIRITTAPKTIVSLAPSLTEIIFELGLGGSLAGCDEGSNSVSGAESLPTVSTWQGLDLEAVVALEPDIVFMDKTLDMSGDIYTSLTGADITVFVFFPHSMDDMLDQIEQIGNICDAEDEADSVIQGLQSRIDAVEQDASGYSDKPKVLYITYYDGQSDPWVGTVSTMSGGLIESAGGDNIISDSTGFGIQISLETILSEDPDIIITSQSSTWPTQSRELILDDERLEEVSAVKNDRVHDIDGNIIDRPGPGMVDGLETINGHVKDFVNK